MSEQQILWYEGVGINALNAYWSRVGGKKYKAKIYLLEFEDQPKFDEITELDIANTRNCTVLRIDIQTDKDGMINLANPNSENYMFKALEKHRNSHPYILVAKKNLIDDPDLRSIISYMNPYKDSHFDERYGLIVQVRTAADWDYQSNCWKRGKETRQDLLLSSVETIEDDEDEDYSTCPNRNNWGMCYCGQCEAERGIF